ncbi:MAG TPA: DUF58 domain-containing protein [Rhodanobacter sp.]|nr:DUF58 domain-containing protein [Rhodanobacter sp.]
MAEERPLNDAERGKDVGLWFGVTVGLSVLALVAQQLLLTLLLLTPALALGAAFIWQRFGLRRVRFSRRIEPARAFPGDSVELSLILENRKPLPLPWLDLRDTFPNALDYGELELEARPKSDGWTFNSLVSAWANERVEQRCTIRCPQRGVYRFGPATLATGDPFGFSMRQAEHAHVDELLVYPRVLPVTNFGLPAAQPFGDARPSRMVPDDPLRFLGTRPYIPSDPPRQIHWRATARTNRVQSKTFERGATAALAVFLDLSGDYLPDDDRSRQDREWAISAAASLVADGLDGQREVGLFSNASLLGGSRFMRVAPSRQRVQLMRILELLAQLIPYALLPIGSLLLEEARRLPWGATVCVVTVAPSEKLIETLWRLQRVGFTITLLIVGKAAIDVPRHGGFMVYHWQAEEQRADPTHLQLV